MIDSRFAMKYPFPHSVVHIIDNSMYTGQLPTVVADDPSLYSTIVVTGSPLGEDNRVIKVTRSDVAATAFGLGNLTTDDIKKYGQQIEYPLSLISQGAPVQLLRVTPEGSTYAVAILLVQWRADAVSKKFHVRFKEGTVPPDLVLERFKNKERLHNQLVKSLTANDVTDESGTWKQTVLCTFIGAGRGSIYNNFNVAINFVPQGKKPANTKYQFVTIDTRVSKTIEMFTASLVNINNQLRTDYTETVNNTVAARVDGSSIVVPRINEEVVKQIYKEYMSFYKDQMSQMEIVDTFTSNCYASLNVNIFDLLFGNYIYGGDAVSDTKLPFYQVDMFDTNVPYLKEEFRVPTYVADPDDYDKKDPKVIYDKLLPITKGVNSTNPDELHIGDLYLTTIGSNNTKPMISIIAAINQYSGSITPITIPKIFPLMNGSIITDDTDPAFKPASQIVTIYNDGNEATGLASPTINQLVKEGKVVEGSIIARVSGTSFKLYAVQTVTTGNSPSYTLSSAYTLNQIRQALSWASHSSGETGTGNVIGRKPEQSAFTRVGATVIDDTTGDIYVNNYDFEYDETADFGTGRIKITATKAVFGKVPTEIAQSTDIVGAYYDVLVFQGEEYTVTESQPVDWTTDFGKYYVVAVPDYIHVAGVAPTWQVDTYYTKSGSSYTLQTEAPDDWSTAFASYFTKDASDAYVPVEGVAPTWQASTYYEKTSETGTAPSFIYRYLVSGVQGSIYRVTYDPVIVPANYYSTEYGINMTSELGGISLKEGTTGFFDDYNMNSIEFKWKYSALLVKAYRGEIDPRILSPNRVPAKFLFDGASNTIVGQTIKSYVNYDPIDIINASSIFTEDEKEEVLYDKSLIANITSSDDIDVKQAMYDFTVERCFQRIPEDKRPEGPGYGLQLNLDAGITDANTAMLMNTSFEKRFDNPNATWDIGGWTNSSNGLTYTYVKRIVDNLFNHIKATSINKPFKGSFTSITPSEYISYFPDIDTTDWELRELMYNSGGNVWVVDVNGNIERRSQRNLYRAADSSDLIQESNMRTLSQLCYLVQNRIDKSLLEYDDDGVLKTLQDEINIQFSTWVGEVIKAFSVRFVRDKNVDGGDILVCELEITFRGLILRVPIIVNVLPRTE